LEETEKWSFTFLGADIDANTSKCWTSEKKM
jgi:hypothetical protein